VPGLFAAGEAAGGLHGANRLNGNGISELLVFGQRAGRHAAAFAQQGGRGRVDLAQAQRAAHAAQAPLERAQGENPHALQRRLQEGMQRFAGLTRDEAGLRAGVAVLDELSGRLGSAAAPGGARANAAWQCALDLRSLILVAEAIVRSALLRHETRGAHVRADFPGADAGLEEMNVVATRRGGRLVAALCTRPDVPPALHGWLEETETAVA
jgi:succinate dehydrogenase / fumarate reductase flavoprotein subunit